VQRSFSESTAGEQSKFANDAAEAALETRETAGLVIWLFKKIFDIRRRRTRNAGARRVTRICGRMSSYCKPAARSTTIDPLAAAGGVGEMPLGDYFCIAIKSGWRNT
jgi:hypothetical protein